VSGFGYGGTNAHVILESETIENTISAYPDERHKPLTNGVTNGVNGNGHTHDHDSTPESIKVNGVSKYSAKKSSEGPHLYVLSAASKISLSNIALNLRKWLSEKMLDDGQLRELSYTLAVRRTLHSWRVALVASNTEDLISQLDRIKLTKSKAPSSAQITFVFTGQGAQWYAMGRELLLFSVRFRDSISRSSELLKQWGSDWSLDEELLRDGKQSRLGESQLAQPATTAIQIALVDLIADLGILPQRVCGHSSGEIGAAYAAGALSHEDALKV
jgi:acyl transferase domain-containing protein